MSGDASAPGRACLRMSATVVLLAGGRASSRQAAGEPARSPAAQGSSTAQALLSPAPGQLSDRVLGGSDLSAVTVTDAAVRFVAGGDGEPTMSIGNDGGAPNPLLRLHSGRGGEVFRGPSGADSLVPPAGALLEPGSTVTLGGHRGGQVLLRCIHGTDTAHDVPFALIFANAELAHPRAMPPFR